MPAGVGRRVAGFSSSFSPSFGRPFAHGPMKSGSTSFRHYARLTAAAAVGLLWTSAFPLADFAGAAWITPLLLLAVSRSSHSSETFRFGYVAALSHYLSSLYWLLHIPFLPGAILGWLALSAYLALFPALWARLSWQWFPLTPKPSSTPLESPSVPTYDSSLFADLTRATWGQRLRWALACAFLWVGLETFRSSFLGGFPWNQLGASLHRLLPLAQFAAIAGVAGLSFVIVWFSISMGLAALAIGRYPQRRSPWLADIALPLFTIVGLLLWGAHRMAQPRPTRGEVKLALVQPSIPQTLIWDPKESSNRFHKLIELSREALTAQPDVLVWPEAAVPNLLRYDRPQYEAITNLIGSQRVWMILGADDAEPHLDNPDVADFYNSSFLLSPAGRVEAAYRKQHLVIFGEFIPFAKWLPFLKKLLPIGDGFEPGTGPELFKVGSPSCAAGILICFEDTIAELTRRASLEGPDFLLNLTNNGWFGESAAHWQHAANAMFRAIENGLVLVRCTNNGLTCWFDPFGRVFGILRDAQGSVYSPGHTTVQIPLPASSTAKARTFYQAGGHWFGWISLGLAFLLGWRRKH